MAMNPRYPIYIPSKGRWERPLTARRLIEMRVPFRIVVEDAEADAYAAALGAERLLVLPTDFRERAPDGDAGSIPARNWIWEHALSEGHKRHWILDDNHKAFIRLHINRRIPVKTSAIFCAAEDFTDRYENVAFSGFHDKGFIVDREARIPPFALNTRIYSATLINNSIPYRWRGRYNEDTDICLRALKDGWVTINFNAFLGDKVDTMTMKGGNTDTVYNTGDHRRAFAESLQRQHPDVVEVVWKFGRWHHQVDYRPFKRNSLRLRPDVTPTVGPNEYGMRLVRVKGNAA